MKEIKVPAPVLVVLGKQQDGKDITESVQFPKFLVDMVDTYGETKTPKQLRQAMRLIDKIEKAGEVLSLEDADFDLLKAAIEFPRQLNTKLARQLGSFYDALSEAGIGKD